MRDHLRRLDALYAGCALDEPFYISGINGVGRADAYADPSAWVRGAVDDCLAQIDRLADRRVFRPLCVEYNPFGVHFVDSLFGARVRFHEGQWWSDPIDTPIGQLTAPNLARSTTWRLVKRAVREFVRQDPPLVVFALPTIASALNVGINLFGERLLVAMAEEPAAAGHDLGVINDLLRRLHQWFRRNLPPERMQPIVACQRFAPPGRGQICGCSTHLVSARAYRDIVAPLDAALLGAYPRPGLIHLCGGHRQHIPAWREMPELGAVQLNDRAADDLAAYAEGLRPDQVIYHIPTEAAPASEALRIARQRPLVLIGEPAEG